MSALAVSYAAVILADADVEITGEKLLALTKTAQVEGIEPIYAQLYAKALANVDKKELLTAFGSTAAAGPAGSTGAAAAAAGGDAAVAEEEAPAAKAEEESESDMDMGMLF